MSMNLVTLLYLIASVFFIQALKGLSHPSTARRGNAFGIAGTLAVALAAVNVFGGFMVTQRMLEMFKKKEPKTKTDKAGASA